MKYFKFDEMRNDLIRMNEYKSCNQKHLRYHNMNIKYNIKEVII